MMRFRKDNFISFSIGIFFGVLIWALSPLITGEVEPWDAKVSYYPIALFISGVIGQILYPKGLIASVFGIYLGQVLYLFIFAFGPLWLIGTILIVPYSITALLGGGIIWYFRRSKGQES